MGPVKGGCDTHRVKLMLLAGKSVVGQTDLTHLGNTTYSTNTKGHSGIQNSDTQGLLELYSVFCMGTWERQM